MIIIEAEINFPKELIHGNFVPNKKIISVGFGNEAFVSQLESLDGKNIPIGKKVNINICILHGETAIDSIKEGERIYFVVDKFYDVGVVVKVKEIYVEKEWVEFLIEKYGILRAKEVVSIAENLENAIVYDDVYELFKKILFWEILI